MIFSLHPAIVPCICLRRRDGLSHLRREYIGGSEDGSGEREVSLPLYSENKEPQMNADERRFITTGNTDDTDLTDFHGYKIRVYPRHPHNPCSVGGDTYLLK